MSSGIYTNFKLNLMNKVVDLEADTINVALFANDLTFTAADDTYSTTFNGTEHATANGYTAGGVALAGKAVSEVGTTAKWDATDAAWTATTALTAYFAVIYDVTATNTLIACIDFGGAKTATGGTFTIQWHADGIIVLS